MSPSRDPFAQARQVANAVLYEEYLLDPHRQAPRETQSRFQFGVLMPPAYRAVDPSERSFSQTECLVQAAESARVLVLVRFLQLRRRTVGELAPDTPGDWQVVASLTVDQTHYTAWDEAIERENEVSFPLASLLHGDGAVMINAPAGTAAQEIVDASGQLAGRIMRTWTDLDGIVTMRARRLPGPHGVIRLTLRIDNHSSPPGRLRDRNDGLGYAFIAAHALIWVPGGSFLSCTDPPQWAAADVAACENTGVLPVLAGPPERSDLVLVSPVILPDHAEVTRARPLRST